MVLAALAVTPAMVVTAWLVAAFPVVWAGRFRPWIVVPLFLVLAVALVRFGLPPVLRAAAAMTVPWPVLAAVVAIAGGFFVFAAATHSEQVILHRDNGSYAVIGNMLARDGSLTKPIPAAQFGGSADAMTFTSPAFYRVGTQLVPQFMTGWTSMVAAGWWVAGWSGELLMPALVGAAGLLAVAGLAARLAGPRWAPLAALVTGLAFPVVKNSQTTFSEMPALLLLVAAVYLLGDVIAAGTGAAERAGVAGSRPRWFAGTRRQGRAVGVGREAEAAETAERTAVAGLQPMAFVSGLVLGVGELVRLDLVLDLALLMPVLAWLWVKRQPGVAAWLAGALLGLGLGALDGLFVTWPYVVGNKDSVKLAVTAFGVSSLVSFLLAAAVRRWGFPARAWPVVSAVGAGGVAVVGLALVVRPYVSTVRGDASTPSADYLSQLQPLVGLAPDGSRTYAEQSLRWVSWYVGWPLLAAAGVGAVVLVWRVLRGGESRWLAALPVYVVSAAIQLWRPSITPDHPYADRRLVVVIVPGVVLLAVWAASAATRALSVWAGVWVGRWRRGVVRPVAVAGAGAVVSAVAFVVPAAAATAPVAAARTEQGEIAAANRVCRSLSPERDTVVLLDDLWVATVREQCRVPAAQMIDSTPEKLAKVTADIAATGRVPVIAANGAATLWNVGYDRSVVKSVVVTTSRQDQQTIVTVPDGTKLLPDLEFWFVRPLNGAGPAAARTG